MAEKNEGRFKKKITIFFFFSIFFDADFKNKERKKSLSEI
jgi:hypothetical protein